MSYFSISTKKSKTVIFLCLLVILSGCTLEIYLASKTNQISNEIYQYYYHDLEDVVKIRDEGEQIHQSIIEIEERYKHGYEVTEEEFDQMLRINKYELHPRLAHILDKLNEVNIESEEVQSLHQLILDYYNLNFEISEAYIEVIQEMHIPKNDEQHDELIKRLVQVNHFENREKLKELETKLNETLTYILEQ